MPGDTTTIRLLATTLRELADDQRHDARRLRDETAAVPWEGWAAEAMRAGAAQQTAAMQHAAQLHDEAADTLDHHAASVDAVRARIAAVEREVHHLVGAARARLGGLLGAVGVVADPVDELLDRFVPPPAGHLDWLDVDLPGLRLPRLAHLGSAA